MELAKASSDHLSLRVFGIFALLFAFSPSDKNSGGEDRGIFCIFTWRFFGTFTYGDGCRKSTAEIPTATLHFYAKPP